MESLVHSIAEHIYKKLGAGYSERVYHNAFEVMLREKNIPYESERIVPIVFEGHVIGHLRADLIIDGRTVVELKAVKSTSPAMLEQLENYLELTGLGEGYLINFPTPKLECFELHSKKKMNN